MLRRIKAWLHRDRNRYRPQPVFTDRERRLTEPKPGAPTGTEKA